MKKRIVIILGALILLSVVAVATIWFMMQQPMYKPGMVRDGKNLLSPLAPPTQSADENYWLVEEDIRLFHFSNGAGKNILIVHGGPGFPFGTPLPGLEPLADRYRFHYYDQRGCGKSSRPIDKFSSSNYYENVTKLDRTLGLGAQIADIERIRQILGEEKIILIGHSFGGFLASLYAAEFPEHVEALILVAPAETLVMPAIGGGLFEEVKKLLPAEMKSEYEDFLKHYMDYGDIFSKSETDLADLNAEFGKYYAAAARPRGFIVPLPEDSTLNGGWMVQAMYFSMGMRHDYRQALRQVDAPVLVIHGENDLQTEQASRLYSETFPHSEYRVLSGAGHFPFYDQPEEYATAVVEFLDQ